MARHIGLIAAALLGICGSTAYAEPRAACRSDSVVEEMQRQAGAQNRYGRIDPRLVQEQPTPVRNVVRCDVCVLDAPYNTTSFGPSPIRRCLPLAFEVKLLEKGYVVRPLP